MSVPPAAREAIRAKGVPVTFAEHRFGYVKNGYQQPDPATAIMVTAKWTCKPSDSSQLDALTHWWQQVGTEAHTLEKGLLRYEVYQVLDEDALIIHEVFENTSELRFHLSKGTAEKYKKHIDKVATPECYFFRGPVSWDIRAYSRFLSLPATYSSQGSHFTVPGGTMSDGTTQAAPTPMGA
jgi:quinol monooxygenase YgiN